MAKNIKQPDWSVSINGTDMTEDMRTDVMSICYSDSLDPEADDIEIALSDPNEKWRKAWSPDPGIKINLTIGYKDAPHLNCGLFEMDEVSCTVPPGIVTLRALSTGVSKSLRTRKHKPLENGSLENVVSHIAQLHNLRLLGPCAHIELGRVTQNDESDLAFLKRLSEDYDHIFTIIGDQLLFRNFQAPFNSPPLQLTNNEIISLNFRDQVTHLYTSCDVNWHDADLDEARFTSLNAPEAIQKKAGVVNRMRLKLETETEHRALAKARAALRKANSSKRTGSIEIIGQTECVAGSYVSVSEHGVYNGEYLIFSASHKLNRDNGYTTSLEISTREDIS